MVSRATRAHHTVAHVHASATLQRRHLSHELWRKAVHLCVQSCAVAVAAGPEEAAERRPQNVNFLISSVFAGRRLLFETGKQTSLPLRWWLELCQQALVFV